MVLFYEKKNMANEQVNQMIEWEALIDRLKYQRQRLQLTKEEVKEYIKAKYGKTFWRLTDSEIIDIGIAMKNCKTKEEFLKKI